MTPFKGVNTITSLYGYRKSPLSGRSEHHNGQDIITSGDWTVRECTGGKVLRIAYDRWRGKYVDIETKPGTIERYQHLHEIFVTQGQKVPQGYALGTAGNSGDCFGSATKENEYMPGRHLHFEVQKNGKPVNPSPWSGLPNFIQPNPGNDTIDHGEGSEPSLPPASQENLTGACIVEIFIPLNKYFEVFTHPDVNKTKPAKIGFGTERWPMKEKGYVVYKTSKLSNSSGLDGVLLRQADGNLAWAAKREGEYQIISISLQAAEKNGYLVIH